ncbi:MAG TPA: hypothetical protein VJ103_01670 [Candidatus Paceibacterota bacterium]|nr:hypothetical protein [Candidatus Paceibacterota bacterium]
MKQKGAFIVIDGIDGTGKETQAKLLVRQLELIGYQVRQIDFPQYKENFSGRILFDCKKGKYGDFSKVPPQAAMLLYAADRFESKAKIEKWLAAKNILIADRYVSANQIHQGGKIKNPKKRSRFIKSLAEFEYGFLKLPKPDAVVFLDAEIKTVLKNLKTRGNLDCLEQNREYLENSQASARRVLKEDPSWLRVNCDRNGQMLLREAINKKIMKVLTKKRIIPQDLFNPEC